MLQVYNDYFIKFNFVDAKLPIKTAKFMSLENWYICNIQISGNIIISASLMFEIDCGINQAQQLFEVWHLNVKLKSSVNKESDILYTFNHIVISHVEKLKLNCLANDI